MIYHSVLFKLKSTLTEEEYENFKKACEGLSSIDGVLSVNINKIIKNAYRDYDDRTKGYTHSLFIVLKDKKSLEYYDKNMLHNMIKSTVIKPLLDIDVESPVLCTDWEDNRICIRNPSGRFDYYLYNKYSYSIAFSILITLGFYTLRVRSRL